MPPLPPLDHLFANGIAHRTRFALAVSGGSDSMALMTLMAEWGRGQASPLQLHVLTVNHALRPEARAEAEAVQAAAQKFGLPCDILTWAGPKPLSGLQAAARAARYRLLIDRARTLGLEALVTGHTADDQAETLLMRLARGSGLRGLSGMAPETTRLGFAVLRPLLAVRRATLRAALVDRGVDYFEDPSNDDARFERVRWRAITPLLEAEGLSPEAFARFAARCRRADEGLDQLAREIADRAVDGGDAGVRLSRDALRRAPLELQIRVLTHLIDTVVGHVAEPLAHRSGYPLADDKLVALATALVADGRVRRSLGGADIEARGDEILFRRENPRRAQKLMHPAGAQLPYGVTRDDHTDLSGVRDHKPEASASRFTTARDGTNEGSVDPSQEPVPDLH